MLRDDVALADEYTSESLSALANGDIGVIWHRGFYPATVCNAVLPRIVEACEAAHYTLTSDLQSLGTSMGEAEESSANAERYVATAAETTSLIRDSIFAEYKAPGDLVRLLADEFWPWGATVGRVRGAAMLPSIIRRWPAGGQANPHIDQRNTALLSGYRLTRRIGVNVYLETPDAGAGGELEFWHTIPDEDEYLSVKREDYGLDREQLPEPTHALLPDPGDLVMFDAARLHGVRRVESGSRVTAACFLGVQAQDGPLIVFA